MQRIVRYLIAGASAAIIFPALCLAQFGAIAGVVKDGSGAAVPNVSVEAANPANIEGARTAVTDSSGQYRIEQLIPGTYTVTFKATGFSTVRQEGVEITEAFTAPVNGSLTVGAVQQTIDVQGQAPVVDVQNVTEEKAVDKLELDALPTAKSFATIGVILPSVTMNQADVGGSVGEKGNVLAAHGGTGSDMTLSINGLAIGNQSNSQSWSNILAQRCVRPGDVIPNGCDFRGAVEWRGPGERDSAGGRQRIPRRDLWQLFESLPGNEQSHL